MNVGIHVVNCADLMLFRFLMSLQLLKLISTSRYKSPSYYLHPRLSPTFLVEMLNDAVAQKALMHLQPTMFLRAFITQSLSKRSWQVLSQAYLRYWV